MVKYGPNHLDRTFKALADPTRRAILSRLAIGEANVGELAAPFKMSLPAVSKHLKILERAKLVARERDGRIRRMRLETKSMKEARAWIDNLRTLWEQQFDSLAQFLDATANMEDEES